MEYIGTRYLNAYTWTFETEIVAVRVLTRAVAKGLVLTVEVLTLSGVEEGSAGGGSPPSCD